MAEVTTKVSLSGFKNESTNQDNRLKSPFRNFDITAVATRAEKTDKKVVVKVTVAQGFATGATTASYTNYKVYFTASFNNKSVDGILNSNGSSWQYDNRGTSRLLLNSNSVNKIYGGGPIKTATVTFTVNEWTSGAKTLKVTFYQGSNKEQGNAGPHTLTVSCPNYSSSSSDGSGSGGGTTTTAHSISAVTFSTLFKGSLCTVSYKVDGSKGTNALSTYKIQYKTDEETDWRDLTLEKQVNAFPISDSASMAFTTYYKGNIQLKAVVKDGSSSVSKVSTSSQISYLPSPPSEAYCGKKSREDPSDSVYFYTNSTNYAWSTSESGTKTEVKTTGTYEFQWDSGIQADSTLYFWGVGLNSKEEKLYSENPTIINVEGYYPIHYNSINVNLDILKTNINSSKVANTIRNASVSASCHDNINYTWKIQTSTSSSISYNSSLAKDISYSNNITKLELFDYVKQGEYFRIFCLLSTNDTSYIGEDSTVYLYPKSPSNVTIKRVIPKANPSNGFTNIPTSDGKTYFGSGLFLIWNNPPLENATLPIDSTTLVYQERGSGNIGYGEIKEITPKYNVVLENDISKNYIVSKDFNIECGGGADFNIANDLDEVRVGVKITDTLGNYSYTWYNKTYYKAKSPNSVGTATMDISQFNPFTDEKIVDDGIITFTSGLSFSQAQDELDYELILSIPEKRLELNVFNEVPISYSGFQQASDSDVLHIHEESGTKVIKQNVNTLKYEVKRRYLKELVLTNNLASSFYDNEGILEPIFNTDYSNCAFEFAVRDDYDSRSSITTATYKPSEGVPAITNFKLKFVEPPILDGNLLLGINKYLLSHSPYSDGSINEVDNSSSNLDRILNPGEAVTLRFKRAIDYNGRDYNNSNPVGDVTNYIVEVARFDDPPIGEYSNINSSSFSLLKKYSVSELKNSGITNGNEKNYLEYELKNYNESKFVIFRIKAVDSKGNESKYIYSNTYIVPCKAEPMDFYISNITFDEKSFEVTLKTKIDKFNGAIFINSDYNYNMFPNYQKTYTIGNNKKFIPAIRMVIEASLDGKFVMGSETDFEISEGVTKKAPNYYNYSYSYNGDLSAEGGKPYTELLDSPQIFSLPNPWRIDLLGGFSKKNIKKIYFRVTYLTRYGYRLLEEEKKEYLTITSESSIYSWYDDAPTVSYRNHQVGINTKDFSDTTVDTRGEVLIVQDNGVYNLIVLKGANEKIIIDLVGRNFYTEDENNTKLVEVNFNSGYIDGMTLDGGSW